ncbi:MAG: YheV family putative metal-binding protein [Pseudomonadales bacterium]|nr:YheV family putative metal-binding protein [Halioglobus sp.]MCP5128382.1 YheV family putative metal-binding protein [Pseudomonadales bacterium]
MSTSSNRRFIAGAVCPRCAQMDKIVVDLETDRRECVACGFTEARPGDTPAAADPAAAAAELPTRVSRAAARRPDTPAEPVRLIDPGSKKQG